VSDKPSREDLSELRYALGEEVSTAVRASLVSEPVVWSCRTLATGVA
jgi:hypothetical protein